MLTDEEKSEISEEFHRYEKKNAVCIDALRIVQRHRGWINDECILGIADFLKMSPGEVEGVATFYNLIFRRPVGINTVFLCDSVSCWIMGGDAIQKYFCNRLHVKMGETTSDGLFTVLPIACLGACDRAPALRINHEIQTGMTVSRIDALITSLSRKGATHEA